VAPAFGEYSDLIERIRTLLRRCGYGDLTTQQISWWWWRATVDEDGHYSYAVAL
jgi:hypothetical protein